MGKRVNKKSQAPKSSASSNCVFGCRPTTKK
jgi:hypothetical protein